MKKLLFAATLLVSTFSVTTFAATADDFPEHFNPNYSEVEATPKDDADARKALKKAYESVYSPRAAGLEAFRASLDISVTAPEVKGQQIKFPPITVQARIEWSKDNNEIDVTLILNFKKPKPKNPLMGMLKTGIERALPQLAPELLDGDEV